MSEKVNKPEVCKNGKWGIAGEQVLDRSESDFDIKKIAKFLGWKKQKSHVGELYHSRNEKPFIDFLLLNFNEKEKYISINCFHDMSDLSKGVSSVNFINVKNLKMVFEKVKIIDIEQKIIKIRKVTLKDVYKKEGKEFCVIFWSNRPASFSAFIQKIQK